MDSLERLKLLSAQMDLEPAEDTSCPTMEPRSRHRPNPEHVHISQAVLPNGRRISLLKSLLTSACERNCYYCPFRLGRDFKRETFAPEEFARTFMNLHQSAIAEGIFLSSGIAGGGIRTQDQLLATAEILRNKLGFKGYLHLKIMPGAERDQVLRAMQLANRLSINLEAPNSERLQALAPHKHFTQELIEPLRWVEQIRHSQPGHLGWNGRWPSTVTQFVVGGAGESDLELLDTTERLYHKFHLSRAYFSRFHPIPETPMENQPATDPRREQRLYQASFLVRDYGFRMEELPFNSHGHLPLYTDPKLAWARLNLQEQPVELNLAGQHDLLRIPGIGPKAVHTILAARQDRRLRSLSQLGKLGINAARAAPFILLDGRRPAYQPGLW